MAGVLFQFKDADRFTKLIFCTSNSFVYLFCISDHMIYMWIKTPQNAKYLKKENVSLPPKMLQAHWRHPWEEK